MVRVKDYWQNRDHVAYADSIGKEFVITEIRGDIIYGDVLPGNFRSNRIELIRRVGNKMSEDMISKAKVLEVAQRVKEEEGWCDDGFWEAMMELGIEKPQPREFLVTVKVSLPPECPIPTTWDNFSLYELIGKMPPYKTDHISVEEI